MDRAQDIARPRSRLPGVTWKLLFFYVPMVAVLGGLALLVRQLTDDGGSDAPIVSVDPGHARRLGENIAFFEDRVKDTNDSLSYGRLTTLYLQRVRETGDVSDIKRAEISATRSIEVNQGAPGGLVNLALVRLAQHDFRAAESLARQALALRQDQYDALAVLGDAQLALGQYDAATEGYRVFLEKAPGFSAYSRQAAMAEARGNLPLAFQYWTAAITASSSLEPENAAWAHVQLGNLQFTVGKVDDAKASFDRALRIFPAYPVAQAGLARVAAARGDLDRAITLYRDVTARLPLPDVVAAYGDTLQKAGKTEEARQQFALMGAIDQLFAANGVRSDLTLILFALDHGGDAVATIDRARIAYDERPSVQGADVLAWALFRAGRYEEARARSDEALRLGTKDPLLFFHAGMIAKQLGDVPSAERYLQQAASLNVNFSVQHAPEVVQALKELKAGRR